MSTGSEDRRIVRSEEYVARAMKAWGASVWRLALSQAPSRQDAEEVYQDVFLRLATDATLFKDDEHLKAWLLRVAVNRCRDYARWKARRVTVDIDEVAHCIPDRCSDPDVLRKEAAHRVVSAVRVLSPKLRVVVHLYYGEELTCDEIAGVLGVKASTVRVRLKRAREQLKQALGSYFDYPDAGKAAVYESE